MSILTVAADISPFDLEMLGVEDPTGRYLAVSADGQRYYALAVLPCDPRRTLCHCAFSGAAASLQRHEITGFTNHPKAQPMLFEVMFGGDRLQAPVNYDQVPMLTVPDGEPEELEWLDPTAFGWRFADPEPVSGWPRRLELEILRTSVPSGILEELSVCVRSYQRIRVCGVRLPQDANCVCALVNAYSRLAAYITMFGDYSADEAPKPADGYDVPHYLVSAIGRPIHASRLPGTSDDQRVGHCNAAADAMIDLLEAIKYQELVH